MRYGRRVDWLSGPVKLGRPATAPHNLGGGWDALNYPARVQEPVRS
jgi:hypothetical protein